jgi:hypothetical protein
MTDNFTPVLIIPLSPCPSPLAFPDNREVTVDNSSLCTLHAKISCKEVLNTRTTTNFLSVRCRLNVCNSSALVGVPMVHWLFQEIAEVQSEFYFVLQCVRRLQNFDLKNEF